MVDSVADTKATFVTVAGQEITTIEALSSSASDP